VIYGDEKLNATDEAGFIGWIRPVHSVSATWRPIVAALDEDLTWDLVRDYAPLGVHVAVTPAYTEPGRWFTGQREHLD
jgi:hypothetical protein